MVFSGLQAFHVRLQAALPFKFDPAASLPGPSTETTFAPSLGSTVPRLQVQGPNAMQPCMNLTV